MKILKRIVAVYRDLFEPLLRAFGWEPEAPEFETTLRMLLPTIEERNQFRDAALTLAQVGFQPEDVHRIAKAFASGKLSEGVLHDD